MLELTPVRICERALRQIGAYPITETGAEPEAVEEALYWLDMIVGHVAGTQDVHWLVPATIGIELTPGEDSYDVLASAEPAAAVANGLSFAVEAWLEGEDLLRTPLPLLSRSAFEALEPRGREGIPEAVYVDRLKTATLKTYPTLPAAETGTYTVRMVVQTYSADFTQNRGKTATNIRQSWNLYLVMATSARIGSGPVRRLPDNEVRELRTDAERLWAELFAQENREHETPTLVAPRSFPGEC